VADVPEELLDPEDDPEDDEVESVPDGEDVGDVVVLDPEQAWVVDPERFLSKGKNSPLGGQTLRGTVLLTVAQGTIAYRNGL